MSGGPDDGEAKCHEDERLMQMRTQGPPWISYPRRFSPLGQQKSTEVSSPSDFEGELRDDPLNPRRILVPESQRPATPKQSERDTCGLAGESKPQAATPVSEPAPTVQLG